MQLIHIKKSDKNLTQDDSKDLTGTECAFSQFGSTLFKDEDPEGSVDHRGGRILLLLLKLTTNKDNVQFNRSKVINGSSSIRKIYEP